MSGDDIGIDKWICAALEDGWDPLDGWAPSEFEADSESSLPPLSVADLPKARTKLAEWADPREFRRLVDGFHKRSRSKELFNDPKRNFLLDAWVLAQLTKHNHFHQVRLAGVDEQWPDGYGRTEAGEQKIEVTTALFPGRHLGAEYRFVGRIQHDPVENWIERAESIPSQLEKAVSNKVKKQYASPFGLVVYLNISEYGIRQVETERAIANIKDRFGSSFQDLWVLWKDRVF